MFFKFNHKITPLAAFLIESKIKTALNYIKAQK